MAKLRLAAYIQSGSIPVRAWTDGSVDEGKTQVITHAEISEISARDPSGKAIAWKIKLDAAARTYAVDDKDVSICDALYASVWAVIEALSVGDFSSLTGGTVRGVMSEPPETSLDDKFNVRIASKSLMIEA